MSALLSDAFCRRPSIMSARALKSDGLIDLSASISSRLSWRPCRSSHTNTARGFCSNASRNSSSVRSLPIRISTLCCVIGPCASLRQRHLVGRGELVEDRRNGLLDLPPLSEAVWFASSSPVVCAIVVAAWPLHPPCQAQGAGRAGAKVTVGSWLWARGHHGRRGGGGVVR